MYLKEFQSNYDLLSLTRKYEEPIEQSEWTTHKDFEYRFIDTGILELKPSLESNKQIVLSSAIHGNETAPIEICNSIIQEIFLGKLKLTHHTLFIMGNPKAINIKKRFSIENLNRLFNGVCEKKEANYEVLRARVLETSLKNFFKETTQKIHYDLHTAIRGSQFKRFAMYPFLHGKAHSKEQLNLLYSAGVQAVVLGHNESTTFSYHSSRNHSAEAFTIELGKVKDFGNNNKEDFLEINSMLRRLLSEKVLILEDYDEEELTIFKVHDMINKKSDKFKLNFSSDVKNFTSFPKGTKLSEDLDDSYISQFDDEAILFPNQNVATGQRAVIIIRPTSIN